MIIVIIKGSRCLRSEFCITWRGQLKQRKEKESSVTDQGSECPDDGDGVASHSDVELGHIQEVHTAVQHVAGELQKQHTHTQS